MHLQIAEEIRAQASSKGLASLSELFSQSWPSFYIGSVAADYQSICDIPRDETHFYGLAPGPEADPFGLMLARYPELRDVSALSADQKMAAAAYGIHLMFDLLWFHQILMPYFAASPEWGDFSQRHLAHHILLTYLDQLAVDKLPAAAADILSSTQPEQWQLPLTGNGHLLKWRDLLVAQLRPGASLQTVEIYARRLKMSPEEFAGKLQDRSWLQAQVFDHVPAAEIQRKLENAVPHSIDLITDYLEIT